MTHSDGGDPLQAEEIRVDEEWASGAPEDFLRVVHRRIRHRRPDGSWSDAYRCDSVVRRTGMDAVAMVLYEGPDSGQRPAPDTVRVGLRLCRRPAIYLDRAGLPDRPRDGRLWEVPAGILEQGECSEQARRGRCSAEAREEMGLVVPPDRFVALGPPLWLSVGVMGERIYLYAAAVSPEAAGRPTGDGSPMEQDAVLAWLPLAEALGRCAEGRSDAKTELGLLRFERWISGRGDGPGVA